MGRSFGYALVAAILLGPAHAADLRDTLAARLAEMRCPGALVGVFSDDGPPAVTVLGSANDAGSAPMHREMRMRIGSVGKMFVGTVVLRLVDAGKLSLDDTLDRYVEGIPSGDAITLRMLGQHRSGLACPIWDEAFQSEILADPQRIWRAEDLVSWARRLPTRHEPDRGWHYSNSAATLLALAAERAAGKPFATLFTELVCQPLGLKSSGVCEGSAPPEPTPRAYRHGRPGRWLGYGDVFYNVTGYSASWAGVGGDMYSTIDDLGVATTALATGSLLSEASRRELLLWRETTWPGVECGFLINRDARGVGHEGNVPGFQAVARYQPDRRRSIVVLTNLSNNADRTMPAEVLFDMLAAHHDAPQRPEAPSAP